MDTGELELTSIKFRMRSRPPIAPFNPGTGTPSTTSLITVKPCFVALYSSPLPDCAMDGGADDVEFGTEIEVVSGNGVRVDGSCMGVGDAEAKAVGSRDS
jgi:hypothetical protein